MIAGLEEGKNPLLASLLHYNSAVAGISSRLVQWRRTQYNTPLQANHLSTPLHIYIENALFICTIKDYVGYS